MSNYDIQWFLKEQTFNATAQLLAVDKDSELPEGWGSGILFADNDRLLLITVLHNALLRATTIQGKLCKAEKGFAMRNRWVHGFDMIKSNVIPEDAATGAPYLDLTFAEIPANETYVRWVFSVDRGVVQHALKRFTIADVRTVLASEMHMGRFSFCANVQPVEADSRLLGTQVILSSELYVPDLTFKDLDGLYYILFETSKPIGEYGVNFAGSSGAPILDENGKVVALVCGGDNGNDRIVRGVRLDALFTGLKDHSLSVEELERNRTITNVAAVLLGFLDEEQKDFYWKRVDAGKVI